MPLTAHLAVAVSITDPVEKAGQTRLLVAGWRHGSIAGLGTNPPPDRPRRPARPELKPPREVPRRRIRPSAGGRIALLHAIAHI